MLKETKPLVLIADDNKNNIALLEKALKNEYRLGIAQNGLEAVDYAEKHHPDLILLDIMMPEMDGFEVCLKLKAGLKTKEIPLIFLSAIDEPSNKTRGFKLGAVDYITKPFHLMEVKSRVQTHLTLKEARERLNAQNIILQQKVGEKTIQIQKMLEATVHAMVLSVESRDPYTAGHQHRVACLASAIAHKMGLSEDQIDTIRLAGDLHDIGKIRIPASLLNRPGKLLEVEHQLIRIHPQVSYDLLKDIPSSQPFAQIVLQHHERLDGSGYPQALSSKDILLEAKILAVADVTEAMSSHRPYRPSLGIDYALQEITLNKGKIYDSDAVDACLELFRKENFNFEQS
jgi:putative two-component system response regulator